MLTRTDVILRNALKINRDEGHSRETAAPGKENISSRSSKQFAKRRLFDDSTGSSRPLTLLCAVLFLPFSCVQLCSCISITFCLLLSLE